METEPKPFYRSRKLAYTVGTFLAALIVAALPTLGLDLEPETTDMLSEMLALVFVLGFLAITGHTLTDIAAQWQEGVKTQTLRDALNDLLDELLTDESEEPPVEVALGDTAK